MKNITYIIAFVFISCLAFISCQEHDDNLPVIKKDVIRVAFNTPDFTQVGTRATSETGIKDITVLQFKEGKLTAQLFLEDKLFSSAVELEGLEAMAAATVNEDTESADYGKLIQNGSENVLVFLANIKAMTGAQVAGFTIGTSTYSNLLAYTATLADADALGNLQYMPMTGTYLNGITDGVTNQISVTLTRALAKINFTLNTTNFTLPSGEVPSITINSISLHNVPLGITFFPSNRPALPANGLPGEWSDMQTPYPAATAGGNTAAADGGIDADNFVTLSTTHNQAANKSTSFIGYMPENARGSYENIANNKQKIPATITDASNRVGLTYLLVDLDYATSDGVIKRATYKIYLGGDANGDMNLLANTQYNVTTYIYGDGSGAADTDTRITVSDVFNPAVKEEGNNSVQSPANSYIINPTTINSIKPNFTIPLTQARNGWRYIHASLKDEGDQTDYTTAFDNMIAGNWTIETLWKTWNTPANANITGTVATGITTETGAQTNRYYATLTIPSDIPVGNNCVIALKDNSGQIWWTWHLWITDYDPDNTGTKNGQTHTYISNAFGVQGLYNGKKMMDRNLGATITGIADNYVAAQPSSTVEAVKWYGLLYQWGRKDPFTNSDLGTTAMDGATKIYDSSDAQITRETDGFPKVNNNVLANVLKDAVQNPMNYYHSSSNWTKQDNNLWSATSKTAFDPCPDGWRVPAGGNTANNNPWAGFYDGNTSNVTGGIYNAASAGNIFDWYVANQAGTAGRIYEKDDTKAWYPTSGSRNNASGAFANVGSNGFYWSSSFVGANGYFLRFYATNVGPSDSSNRAFGFSIRCIQQ